MRDRFAFLGGATASIFVTETGSPAPRPTKDVDAIITCKTYPEYVKIGEELRRRGFVEDDEPKAPVCRWVLRGTGIKVDFMPTDPTFMGMQGHWFEEAFQGSTYLEVSGEKVRLVSAPCFLATKLEAFRDRGNDNYLESHDLEDIISVINGRAELAAELERASPAVRDYVRAELSRLLATDDFLDAVPGHLRGDASSQARVPFLMKRLRLLAGLPQ
jgi:predicted nucleotidyltransferase